MHRIVLIAQLVLIAPAAIAQTPRQPAPGQRCAVVPDSARGPTPGQIRERNGLRDTLVAVARRNGVAQPTGLLFVDVDSTRRGRVLFLDSNFSPEAVRAGTARVSRYLETLPPGRGYQTLVRVNGDFPAMTPGRRHCAPMLASDALREQLMQDAIGRHPLYETLSEPVTRRVMMSVVVNRDGGVSWVGVTQPSGDAFVDEVAPQIVARLRFHPLLLDGTPYDARFRYDMAFIIE